MRQHSCGGPRCILLESALEAPPGLLHIRRATLEAENMPEMQIENMRCARPLMPIGIEPEVFPHAGLRFSRRVDFLGCPCPTCPTRAAAEQRQQRPLQQTHFSLLLLRHKVPYDMLQLACKVPRSAASKAQTRRWKSSSSGRSADPNGIMGAHWPKIEGRPAADMS